MEDQRKNNLKKLRCEFVKPRISQEDIARVAGISLATMINAEKGKRIRKATALAIHIAINDIRKHQGMKTVSLENMGMNF